MAIIKFFNVAVCGEIIAFLTALLLLSNKRYGYWRLFAAYLAIVIIMEFGGFYFSMILRKPNYPFYHFLMLCQAAFFSLLFYEFHVSDRIRRLIVIVSLSFFSFFIMEWVMAPGGSYFQYSRQYLSFLIVLFSCTFYFSVLRNDLASSPLTYPPFWIVTGLFFYYFGTAVMFAFSEKVSQIKLSGNLSFYTIITGSLSTILYGSWIIGFLCGKKQSFSR